MNQLKSAALPWRDAPEDFVPEWIVDRIWQKNGLNFILGSPKAHKSMLRRYLAACALTGAKAFGGYAGASVGGPVLMCIGEDHPGAEKREFSKLLRAMGDERRAHGERISWLHADDLSLSKAEDMQALAEWVQEDGIELVVFDSMRAFHPLDENSSAEMQPVLKNLTSLKKLTTVVVVHHSGKPLIGEFAGKDTRSTGEKARGTGAIAGYGDSFIYVKRVGKSDRHTIEFELKDGQHIYEFDHALFNFETGLWRPELEELQDDFVLQVVRAHPRRSKNTIARLLGYNKQTALTKLAEMLKEGTLRDLGSGAESALVVP